MPVVGIDAKKDRRASKRTTWSTVIERTLSVNILAIGAERFFLFVDSKVCDGIVWC